MKMDIVTMDLQKNQINVRRDPVMIITGAVHGGSQNVYLSMFGQPTRRTGVCYYGREYRL